MPEFRLLVCGSREWTDRALFGVVMRGYLDRHGSNLVIVEGANPRGADAMAGEFAKTFGVQHLPFPARWSEYAPEDRWRAGHDRNREMLQEGRPHQVVAFKDGLRPNLDKGGTENMLRIAMEALPPVPTVHISHGPSIGEAVPSLW